MPSNADMDAALATLESAKAARTLAASNLATVTAAVTAGKAALDADLATAQTADDAAEAALQAARDALEALTTQYAQG